jgi:RNA polymerase sigma-70 factor, ECF subfamily
MLTPREEVAQLFEEAREEVYHYLLALGLYPQQAKEVVQEAFLRLHVALRNGDAIKNPRAWIFRVAHNIGLKMQARENNRTAYAPDLAAWLMDPDRNPEQSFLERERMLRFHRAIEELSDQQRRCFLLRVEGLRYSEIGAVLGINASTVAEFLRRAVARLKKVTND